MSLTTFLSGLGIQGAGANMWKLVVEAYPTLARIRICTVEEISAIKGFAEKSAKQIVQGLATRSQLIEDLLAVGIALEAPTSPVGAQPWVGLAFVITGALSQPREHFVKMIESLGGKVTSKVTAKTHALITDDPHGNSTKLNDARALKVAIWSESEILLAHQREMSAL